MKSPFLKKTIFILLSLILIGLIFASGYFTGSVTYEDNFVPLDLSGTESSDGVDFSSFWKVWDTIDNKYIAASSTDSASDQDRVYGAIFGMVDALDDPYTVFLQPEEHAAFTSSIQGNFQGVGMEIGIEEDVLTVIAPLKNTPAERAGIQPGDKIVEIDEISTQGITIEEAVRKIRGEGGTEVVLKVFREGVDDLFSVGIIRDTIHIPPLDHELREDGVYVISLYNFSATSAEEFRSALRSFILAKKSRLILDLRGNPGGYLQASVQMASWFLPAGKVVVSEDFGDEKKVFRSQGQDIFNDSLKMVILVNKGSASASEILAGALQEHNIATLVGTQTFGKGSVQELVEIDKDTSLKVTVARWLTPNGISISDGGLTPDVIVDESPEGVNLFDYQLEEAVRILNEM